MKAALLASIFGCATLLAAAGYDDARSQAQTVQSNDSGSAGDRTNPGDSGSSGGGNSGGSMNPGDSYGSTGPTGKTTPRSPD